MMDFPGFIQWAFLGLITAGVGILYQMKASMNDLNTKLAVFVERLSHHETRLEKLDKRLDNMERVTVACEFHRNKVNNGGL
jgi:hypothetical protein